MSSVKAIRSVRNACALVETVMLVALANRLARIVWAARRREQPFADRSRTATA